MSDQHTAATYLPPATHVRSDRVDCCPHGALVAPGSCEHCWELHVADCAPCWEAHLDAVRADVPRLTQNPGGGWLLHLPDFTHLDTQVWSVGIGLTDEALTALRTLLAGQPDGAEHCVHSRAIHHRYHQQPVTGCPWCAQPGTTLIDPGDLL